MSAIISQCGSYRYRLEREVSLEGKVFAYFGVNPSTANASINDATVRKWIGFTKVNGGRSFIVGNVFAFRAKDVNVLSTTSSPCGPDNAQHIQQIIDDADVLVPCWGNQKKVGQEIRHHFNDMMSLLIASRKPIKVFGFTQAGHPKHPLMLGYATELVDINGGAI